MKNIFIDVKYSGKIEFPIELAKNTPKKLVISGSIQYLDYMNDLKSFLEENGKTVFLFQSRHGRHPGQILGCDIFPFEVEEEFDAFVYLGDGMFHPTALLFNNNKSVYIYNPMSKNVTVLDKDYLNSVLKRKKGMLAKFIEAKKVGVLVTRKPGQNQSRAVKEFRSQMEGKGKEIYVFLTDHIDVTRLEDFNFIDVWINTACPRIVEDFKCVNLRDLQEIGYFDGKNSVF